MSLTSRFKQMFAKPESRLRAKGRERRAERTVAERVRAACVVRDRYCRLAWTTDLAIPIGACDGPSEWAHLHPYRRFQTVGRAPEQRHATMWTMMLCKRHHEAYDAHDFEIEPLSERGADANVQIVLSDRLRQASAFRKYREI